MRQIIISYLFYLGLIISGFSSLSAQEILVVRTGNTNRVSLSKEPPITSLKGISNDTIASWGYFWETGDGNFSREESFNYKWRGERSREIRLRLTPRYATATTKPKSFVDLYQVQSPTTRETKLTYKNSDKLGQNEKIKFTTNHLLVPGHELRVVVLYEIPPRFQGKDCYLLIGFNDQQEHYQEVFDFTPSPADANPSRYFNESYDFSYKNQLDDIGAIPSTFSNFLDQHAIKVDLDGNLSQQRRCFLSLMPKTNVLNEIINNQRINKDIRNTTLSFTLRAALVSLDPSIKPEEVEVSLPLYTSQDPNRVYAADRVIRYFGNQNDTLFYKITFSNTGEGAENKVILEVPIPPQLKFDSLVSLERSLLKTLPLDLPLCNDLREDDSPEIPCVQGRKIYQDGTEILKFTFHNIYLAGARAIRSSGNNKKQALNTGEIIFPIITNPDWSDMDQIALGADIIFGNAGDTVNTGKSVVFFRRFVWAAKAGFTYALPKYNPEPFLIDDRQRYGYWLGFSWGTNPVRKGWSWESEVNYFSMKARRTDEEVLFLPTNPELQGSSLNLDTELNTHFLDILVQRRYHISPWVGIGVGGGFSLLLKGKSKVEGRLATPSREIVESEGDATFGLFNWDSKDDLLEFGDIGENYQLLPNPAVLQGGALAFADLRVGQVNKGLALGTRYSWRFPNQLYNAQISQGRGTLEVYLMWSFNQLSKSILKK